MRGCCYDEFELRLEQARAEREAAASKGASRVKLRRLEEGVEELDSAVSEMFGFLNPVLMHGQPTSTDEVRCRSKGCPTWVGRREAFDQMSFCRKHYEIAVGLAEPPGPTDLERMIDSVT